MSHSPQLDGYHDSDLDELHAFVVHVIRTCYPAHYPPRAVAFFVQHHARERIATDGAKAVVLVVKRRGRIIGTGTLKRESITRVFVDPALQGQGIGNRIMDELESRARNSGLLRLTLDASLPAVKFYQARGYRTISEHATDVGEGQELRYFAMEKEIDAATSNSAVVR